MCLEDLPNFVCFIEKINLWRSPRESYHLVRLLAFSIWLPPPIAKCQEGFLCWAEAGCGAQGQYAKSDGSLMRWDLADWFQPAVSSSLLAHSQKGQHLSNKNWSNLIAGSVVADYLLIFWRNHNISKSKLTQLLQHCASQMTRRQHCWKKLRSCFHSADTLQLFGPISAHFDIQSWKPKPMFLLLWKFTSYKNPSFTVDHSMKPVHLLCSYFDLGDQLGLNINHVYS